MDDRPQHYPSDISDEQWAVIEPLLPAVRTGGRPEKHPRRAIVDAIRYKHHPGHDAGIHDRRRVLLAASVRPWPL
jgi:transposase